MASSPVAADAEPLAACHARIDANRYRPPAPAERERLEPCRYCFDGGEIDVPDEELLVPAQPGQRGKLHRHQDTGPLEWEASGAGRYDITNALQDDDVTSLEELREALEEGGDS